MLNELQKRSDFDSLHSFCLALLALGVPALLDLAASSSKASFEAAQLLAKAADAAARPEIQKAFAKLQMDQVEIPKVGKQLQPLMVPPLLVALKGEEKASIFS